MGKQHKHGKGTGPDNSHTDEASGSNKVKPTVFDALWWMEDGGLERGKVIFRNHRDSFMLCLGELLVYPNVSDERKKEIVELLNFLTEHLLDLKLEVSESEPGVLFSPAAAPEHIDDVVRALQTPYSRYAMFRAMGQMEAFLKENPPQSTNQDDPKTHTARPVKTKGGAFRVSKHAISQTVKPPRGQMELPLYETIVNASVKDKVMEYGGSVEWINQKGEGINLTGPEHKLVICLMKLVQDMSPRGGQNTGNAHKIVSYEGRGNVLAAGIRVTLYNLTREYIGDKRTPSGKEMDTVKGLLDGLASDPNKMALIRYERKTESANGKRVITDKVETFAHLVQIETLSRRITEGGQVINYREEIVVRLHPVFTDEIENNFVLLPRDINARLQEANGGPKIPAATFKLVNLLAREVSSRRYNPERQKRGLLDVIAPELVEAHKMKRAEEALESAISACTRIGLINSHEVQTDQTGGPKYVFNLNRDWAKARTGLRTSGQ